MMSDRSHQQWHAVALTPILRVFDEAKAKEFYAGFLGGTVDWEHRYGPDFPLYMQVALGGAVLHLSEHYGDGSPGANVRIELSGIEAFHRMLAEQKYKYARPGLEQSERERYVQVSDPFGNRLTFFERLAEGD